MAELLIVKNQGQQGNFSMIDSSIGDLMTSKGSWQVFNSKFQVMKPNGADLREYGRASVTYRDDSSGVTGTPITFASDNSLRNKLLEVGFLMDMGSDGIQSIVAGTNITVDNTDPNNPIINAAGGGGGGSSLQEFYDADPSNTTITDGDGNTVIIAPSAVFISSDVDASGVATVSGTIDSSGAQATITLEKIVDEIVSHLDLTNSDGAGTNIDSRGNFTQGVNGDGFSVGVRIDNITDNREHQRPDAPGIYAVSASSGATTVTADASGNLDISSLVGGGGLTNPLTEDLELAANNINDVGTVTAINYEGGAMNLSGSIYGDGIESGGDILAAGDVQGATFNGSPLPTQYTTEEAQDAIGGMVDSTIVYNDGTPSLGRAAISGDIVISAGSNTAAIGAGVIVDADVNASAAIAGTKLANTPAGNIAATTVQAAINELDSEKQATIAGATGIASLGTPLQLIRINSAGTALEYYTPAYPKKSTTAGTLNTGVITEQLLQSIPITGGDFSAGNLMYIALAFDRPVVAAGTTTIRIRVNTTAGVAGTVVGMLTSSTTAQSFGIERTLEFLPLNFIGAYPPAQAAASDKTTPSNLLRSKTIALDPSANWVINITGQNTQNADSVNTSSYLVERK